ncbi:uncharacterized protein LOC126967702 [Leptidea sinapis]|uniref:uncharacterized protein LOC126967702 n=1 Tax=Leptidea sinapis TaxID=189913 RepID=UPI0021C38510|nr:uncharacterized protein LOC126967702 [Leptidea sinapis]
MEDENPEGKSLPPIPREQSVTANPSIKSQNGSTRKVASLTMSQSALPHDEATKKSIPSISSRISTQKPPESPVKIPSSPPRMALSPPRIVSSPPRIELSPSRMVESSPRVVYSPPRIVSNSPRKFSSPTRFSSSPPRMSSSSPPRMSSSSPPRMNTSPVQMAASPPSSLKESDRVSIQNSRNSTTYSTRIPSPPSPKRSSLKEENAEGYNKIEKSSEVITPILEELNPPEEQPPAPVISNINKIATMSKILTKEANALRLSIKSLTEDINKTKKELKGEYSENVNFPYHLFLIELIVNKIHMKCDCFELDHNNLVITAQFLGKQPIVLYDSSYGKILDFNQLNVGKSVLFAMTYDKICSIQEFVVNLEITKQPPCSPCVTRIAATTLDYTKQFSELREELCKKWSAEQPADNIMCTTSTPLHKQFFYLCCGDSSDSCDSIGMIEMTMRMSFLGKEITTAFCASSKPKGTSSFKKEDNGMTMYSCQNVEMDAHGQVLLDEDSMTKTEGQRSLQSMPSRRPASPASLMSGGQVSRPHQGYSNYDEIFTKVNANELKIRVPKSTKVDRIAKYNRMQELCTCEETPYNTGDQIQFEMPKDYNYPDKSNNTFTSNLKYTHNGCRHDPKDRKIINVTPTNCPVPVDMQKEIHPQKDVFILKIGKKLETKDKKTDLEIELVTPKVPKDEGNTIGQQCSSTVVKSSKLKNKTRKNKSKTNLKKKKSKTKSNKKSKNK